MDQISTGRKCVVADDVRSSRELLRRWMTEFGFEVAEESDGESAYARLEAGDQDLLITDIEMPRLSGLELLHRLRAHPRDAIGRLPVIMVTGLIDSTLGKIVDDFGAMTVIQKPLCKKTLSAVVGRVMRGVPVERFYESEESLSGGRCNAISRSLRQLVQRANLS